MEPEDIHVLPVNDLAEHESTVFCGCKPRIEIFENGHKVIVHNSYDGREITERAIDEIGARMN